MDVWVLLAGRMEGSPGRCPPGSSAVLQGVSEELVGQHRTS